MEALRGSLDFIDVVDLDAPWLLGFRDDFLPSWTYTLDDDTRREIFDTCPTSSFTETEPALVLAVAKDTDANGNVEWKFGSTIAPHPGSFATVEEQIAGYFEPLTASLEAIEPSSINQTLHERYAAWEKEQGSNLG